jgi:poly(3-hydroxybutyrate) depolymerase
VLHVPPLLTALGVTAFASAQSVPDQSATLTGFLDKTIAIDGREHRYVLYVPPIYVQDAKKEWPLLVFLHGVGECGTDGSKQIDVGLGPAIRKDPDRWPFVVVFPQKPDPLSLWAEHEALVMGALAATQKEYRIDASRRYLTGLSQGGAGTWALGGRHVDVFAAIAPVCGDGKAAEIAAALKATPIWAFHGSDDTTVPVLLSKNLCAAVEKEGGHPVLTVYEHTGHNSWDKTYGESNLAEWLRIVPLLAFSPYDVFAAALQDRPRPHRFGFEVELANAQQRVTMWLHAEEAGWKWGRGHERGVMSPGAKRPAYAADGEPELGSLSPREGEASFAECVRILVRGGVLDSVPGERPEGGAYVSFDVMGVPGGERARRYWPVRNAPDQAVEAIRLVSEKIAQFR